jgi:RecA-family ATPase
MNNAEQFQKLFSGNEEGYGLLKNGEHSFVRGQPTTELYQQHLEGKISLGIVPITKNSTCRFGAIDLDDHHDKPEGYKFDYKTLLEKIKFLNLPLAVCKSKSGGAHCYLFLDKFYNAGDVQHILNKFVYALGYERGIEIFPKQKILKPNENGNFINLPYYKGNSRVLINFEGKELNLTDAMLYAPKRVTNEANWSKFKLLDHDKSQHRNDRTFAYGSFAKKHYPNEWEQKIKDYNQLFNDPPLGDAIKDKSTRLEDTVIKSLTKKDYHQNIEEDAPTELVGYDISEYRNLEIKKPVFITERLFKENSINFLVGPKGKGKTELALGFANAMVRGLPFLHYKNPYANPVLYIDGEMDPYDIIERDTPYLKTFGPPPKNYLHVINWHFQKNQTIPDIREKSGQQLILNYLKKVENLTNKKPFVILDNLRSLSNYLENDSDSWRPIGLFLRDLRGHGYSSEVLDHTGKDQKAGMRGTSSKGDWANVIMQIVPEDSQGTKFMKMKIHFDKARGLKPDETADYICQYDFNGNWTRGHSAKEKEDNALRNQIKEILNKAREKKPTQEQMGTMLKISAGKVNKLMKDM